MKKKIQIKGADMSLEIGERKGDFSMSQQHGFFGLMARLKLINRWSLMRSTRTENLAEHSLEVAMIAHALCTIGNAYFEKKLDADRAAVYALYHDVAEIITGDLPTPVKYFSKETKETYRELENTALHSMLSMLPKEIQPQYRQILFFEESEEDQYFKKLVKAADKISAWIKCVEEETAGNREFMSAKEMAINSLKAMELPEVEMFMQLFGASYGLDLDSLSAKDRSWK